NGPGDVGADPNPQYDDAYRDVRNGDAEDCEAGDVEAGGANAGDGDTTDGDVGDCDTKEMATRGIWRRGRESDARETATRGRWRRDGYGAGKGGWCVHETGNVRRMGWRHQQLHAAKAF
ncbi:hypothetical protein CBR_g90048, partial [Chara braunii]